MTPLQKEFYEFVYCFSQELRTHLALMEAVVELNPESGIGRAQIEEFVKTYKLDQNKVDGIVMGVDLNDDSGEPDYDKIAKYVEDDFLAFTYLMAFFYCKHLRSMPDDFRYTDFMYMKNMVEAVMSDSSSDQSIYTRLILAFKIPIELVPQGIIRMLHKSDEFVMASNIVNSFVEKMRPISEFMTSQAYRDYTNSVIDNLISTLHDKCFFGTLEKKYFVEVLMCYKMGLFAIGPCYRIDKEGFTFAYPNYDAIVSQTDVTWDQRWRKNG